MKIAFIGLGNMGGGMAANLVKAGHDVRAFDLSPDALAAAEEEWEMERRQEGCHFRKMQGKRHFQRRRG